MGGQKASTSRGNVIWTARRAGPLRRRPAPLLPDRDVPETRDTDFTYDELMRRNNDELVATWGNLVHRVLTFTQRNFGGAVPRPDPLTRGGRSAAGRRAARLRRGRRRPSRRCTCATGWTRRWRWPARLNRYLDEQAPWKAIKTDPAARGDDHLHGDPDAECPEAPLRALHALLVAAAARAAGLLRRRGASPLVASPRPRRPAPARPYPPLRAP